MVALIESDLEATVPMRKCRLNRGKGATDDLVRLNYTPGRLARGAHDALGDP